MEKKSSSTKYAIIALAVVLIASFFIPAEHWSGWISEGSAVSPGKIAKIDRLAQKTTIQLGSADGSGGAVLTNTFITIDGIPSDASVGQDVQVGHGKNGLSGNTSQKVQIALWEKGNFFGIHILGAIAPFQLGAASYTITDIQTDGTQLKYYVSSGPKK